MGIMIFQTDGRQSKSDLHENFLPAADMNIRRQYRVIKNVKEDYGKGDFGNIKSKMKPTCKSTLITFITIQSNTVLLNRSNNGLGQHSINIKRQICIAKKIGQKLKHGSPVCQRVNETQV